MKKTLLILFGLINMITSHAQSMDSVYYVRIISKEDQGPLPFTSVTANGIMQGETNGNGVIKLERGKLDRNTSKKSLAQLEVSALGFKTLRFSGNMLVLRDTIELFLEKQPILFDEVQIIAYKVPLIESKHSKKKKK